jgi:hypothetical protein
MKKYLLIAVIITAASSAYGTCFWQKITEITGTNGEKVCQWKCGIGTYAKYTTTSGYGYCPRPF